MKTKLLLLIPVLVLGSMSLFSQDIHFSQFYNAPLTLNPALTGISKGDIRLTSLYRSQWNTANSPYKTFNVSAEKKFYDITHDRWWFSGGIDLFSDQAGDGRLSNNHVVLTGSYTRMIDRYSFLSLGLTAGVGQRGFDLGNFTFDNMWNGDVFDPTRSPNESFDDTNIWYPDLGAGVNLRRQWARKRTKVDFGVGLFHVNQPDQRFYKKDNSSLLMRASFYAIPVVQVNEKGDVVGAFTAQNQGQYFEALANVGYRYYLSTQRAKEVALQLSFGYRFNAIGDAFMPAVEVQYRDLMVGLSWDMNVSQFSEATRHNGGPEIAIRYIFHKVYPIKLFKACPLI
ncbi:MAG: PorP/SprF family type IX secretion system membrane protein [Saprospiraceae bacterium]|nr:PorP/SprF family type IX secretion system membrane protein [Saprospiraceae bacterium]MCF8248956.1 PorP/SprF family type IX secretion system membrane protein [Saprospiraceae bacterium]MCF8279167.1 PorP/SprF family type IX secretion system membrane protein [Bacteroidales bacterium]MCF8310850.1 PorP/SprF family type IX secretion system membrane protein [Saprospiraceae bacterium]MCF8439562.1 PorP/SprF family type IX secretion system membrane protein [Saprospiraceae bacterium]